MANFDDKNLFDDDFDLFSESAENLFSSINNDTAKKTENISENQEKNIQEKTEKKENKTDKEKNNKNQKIKKEKVVKEKVQKVKKVKQPKEKQVHKKLGKFAIFSICFLAVALVVVCTGGGLYIKHITTKLETPTFEIYQNSIINISKVKNAVQYEIIVSHSTSQTQPPILISNNVYELSSYLSQPGEVNVKVRALGKTQKAHSDYSQIKTILNDNISLATPRIRRNRNLIEWNAVKNAQSYKLFYRVNSLSNSVEFVTLNSLSFNLEQLNSYGPNVYNICVQAIAQDGSYFVDSDYSNTIEYIYSTKLAEPYSPELNRDSKTFTVYILEEISSPSSLELSLGLSGGTVKEYIISLNDCEFTLERVGEHNYRKYVLSLNELVMQEIMNGKIVACSNSQYVNNSNEVNIVLN